MKNRTLIVIIAILLILVGIFFVLWKKERDNLRENIDLTEALQSENETWKDKNQQLHVKTQILVTQSANDFIKLQSKDSAIINLQSLVKEYKGKLKDGGTAGTIGVDTDVDDSSPTTVTSRDTVIINNKIYIYPEYKSVFNLDDWVYGSVVSNKDTTTVKVKVKNDFDLIIGTESEGFLKGRKPFAELISKNPHSEVKKFRVYSVEVPRQKRWSIGPSISYGIDSETNTHITLSVSLQYSMFRF